MKLLRKQLKTAHYSKKENYINYTYQTPLVTDQSHRDVMETNCW